MQKKERGILMRKFNSNNEASQIINPNIINLLTQIHEFKGKQDIYTEAKPDILSSLLSVAKIQSISSSNIWRMPL
mgnify:CR=1 FL=1